MKQTKGELMPYRASMLRFMARDPLDWSNPCSYEWPVYSHWLFGRVFEHRLSGLPGLESWLHCSLSVGFGHLAESSVPQFPLLL